MDDGYVEGIVESCVSLQNQETVYYASGNDTNEQSPSRLDETTRGSHSDQANDRTHTGARDRHMATDRIDHHPRHQSRGGSSMRVDQCQRS